MSDSALKKEFNQADVQRIRNIVNKDYTSKTKSQSGYRRSSKRHKEGDIWEEGGKQWTIKNGLKQNITKLDSAKKAVQTPLICPKCGGSMHHHLSKKIYKIHKMCFNCFIDYEAELRRNGLYEDYLMHSRKGNLKLFIKELEQRFSEALEYNDSFVTEQGDVEDWQGMSASSKKKILQDLKNYTSYIRKQL